MSHEQIQIRICDWLFEFLDLMKKSQNINAISQEFGLGIVWTPTRDFMVSCKFEKNVYYSVKFKIMAFPEIFWPYCGMHV